MQADMGSDEPRTWLPMTSLEMPVLFAVRSARLG